MEITRKVFGRADCWICGERREGRFSRPDEACGQHSQAERDFFLSIAKDVPLSRQQRAMRRAYMLGWRKPYVQLHSEVR